MMGDSHHRLDHFVGADLVNVSSVTARLDPEDAQHRKPPLLRYTFSWKHLKDPAELGRLEEFNEAVRRLESDHPMEDSSAAASHGGAGARKRKSGEICHEVVPALALESVGQVQVDSVVVIAAQSEIVVDADVCRGSGGPEKKPLFPRLNFLCRKGRDAENGLERALPGKTDHRAEGGVNAFACKRISNNDDIRSPSISAPADVVFGDQIDPAVGEHPQVSAPESVKVSCAGDKETSPSSCPESPASPDGARTEGDLTTPLQAYHLQVPAPISGGDFVGADDQDSGPSSPNPSDDTVPSRAPSPGAAADNTGSGGLDLLRLGERIAMEMDEDALRSEVARQFGAERQRRAARRQPAVAVAPRVHFSLRLSYEEAMEDVAAVAVPEDVKPQAPAGHHGTRKRRRGG